MQGRQLVFCPGLRLKVRVTPSGSWSCSASSYRKRPSLTVPGEWSCLTALCLLTAPSGSSALPANLCPVSGCGEFARFRDDFREPVRESVEVVAGIAVWEGAAEHFKHMLRSDQGIDYSTETSAKRCK